MFEGRLRDAAGVDPVEAGMIEDDVEDDADAFLMRGVHQFDEIAPRAEPRIDIEEMLDAVTVERVQVPALLEDGAEPDGGNAQVLNVLELGLHSLDASHPASVPRRMPPSDPSASPARQLPWAARRRDCAGRATAGNLPAHR